MNKFLTALVCIAALAFPGTAAAAGWNVTVSTNPTTGGAWAPDGGNWVFTPSGSGANVAISEVEAYLNSASVTVRTDDGGGPAPGLLTVNGAIRLPSALTTLTLHGGDVQINSGIEGRGGIVLQADDGVVGTTDDVTVGSGVYFGGYLTADRISSLAVAATNYTSRGGIYATGPLSFDARVKIPGSFGAITSSGDVTFPKGIETTDLYTSVTADTASGTVRVVGGITSPTGLLGATLSGTAVEFGGALPAAQATVNIYGNLTLTADTQISATSLTTAGTVTGNHWLQVVGLAWNRQGAVNVRRLTANLPTTLGNDPNAVAIRATDSVDMIAQGRGTISSDGPITLQSISSTGSEITVNTPGITTLGNYDGATSSFSSLVTDAAGTNRIRGTWTPSATMDINGPTTTTGSTTINGTGAVTFDSLTGGGGGFSFTSAAIATTTELGTVSGTFWNFTVSGAGARFGGTVTGHGSITATAPLELTAATTLTTTTGGNISTGTSLSGAFPITTSSTSLNQFGALGAPTPTSITATGPTRMTNDLQMVGDITVTGTLRLDDDVDVISDTGTLSASGAVQLGSTSTSVNEVTGIAQFSSGLTGVGNLRKLGAAVMTLAGTSTATGRITVVDGELAVSGAHATLERVDVTGGTLRGTGSLPDVNVSAAATLRPGTSGVGSLATGDLRFAAGASLAIGVTGGAATAIDATGTVNLANAALQLTGDPASITVGQPQVIVTNDGSDSVSEVFAGIDHGTVIQVAPGVRVRVNYRGGDGNDISLHRVLASTTALAVDAPTSSVGDDVQLTATVTGIVSSPGPVRFYRGGVLLGAVTPTGGVARLTLTSLPLGASTIEARYAGDSDVETSTSVAVVHTVSTRPMPAPDFTPDPDTESDPPVVPTEPTQPTQPVQPIQPTGDTTRPVVTIQVVATSLVVAERAIPTLRTTISCAATEVSCRYATAASIDVKVGRRTVRVALASRTTTLAGGQSRIIAIPLGIRARAQLARTGTLRVRLVTRVIDAANNQAAPDTRFAALRLKR